MRMDRAGPHQSFDIAAKTDVVVIRLRVSNADVSSPLIGPSSTSDVTSCNVSPISFLPFLLVHLSGLAPLYAVRICSAPASALFAEVTLIRG